MNGPLRPQRIPRATACVASPWQYGQLIIPSSSTAIKGKGYPTCWLPTTPDSDS